MPVPGYAICISIHTPARGVTEAYQKGGLFIGYFNPHSRKGSDTMGVTSTDTSWYFNPHSHKGSDRGKLVRMVDDVISIHTPTRGVTKARGHRMDSSYNFNPHSHKGSDDEMLDLATLGAISIHTPTRGVTRLQSYFFLL